MDCSPPGSSVHEIFQARILESVAISFSRESSRPKNRTQVSCIADRFCTVWATQEAPKLKQYSMSIHLSKARRTLLSRLLRILRSFFYRTMPINFLEILLSHWEALPHIFELLIKGRKATPLIWSVLTGFFTLTIFCDWRDWMWEKLFFPSLASHRPSVVLLNSGKSVSSFYRSALSC